jgi:uncharacterized membrane-anchored protein
MRKVIALVAGIAVLAAATWTIFARERHLAEGRLILLELAPVDPRSLMQGDYMALRFALANQAFGPRGGEYSEDGHIVVHLDARGVASFVRRDGGGPLAPDEARLRYRVRNGQVKFATNAFFFQEGHARYYERARFGEFRASASGELLLTALRGTNLETLGPPVRP